MQSKVFIKCLILSVIFTAMPSKSSALKKEISRMEMLLVLDGDPNDERLQLERCYQSSSLDDCIFAIDDDINQVATSTECSITNAEKAPWFEARLESPSYVTRVNIFGIEKVKNHGLDALTNFELSVGSRICIEYRSLKSFLNKTFACDAFADHIRIQSRYEEPSVLALCEVVAYGKVVRLKRNLNDENARFNGELLGITNCIASSQKQPCEGMLEGKCFESEAESVPFLEVLLANPTLLRRVRLMKLNANHFEVNFNMQLCFRYQQERPKDLHTFNCTRFGSSLRIIHKRNKKLGHSSMTMCGIELYGFPIEYVDPPTSKYLGCYSDKKYNRDLQKLAAVNHMSRSKCELICRRRQMPYFGLQRGKQCWCSERYGIYGQLAEDSCWMQCDNDQYHQCGAAMKNSVYEIEKYGKSAQP